MRSPILLLWLAVAAAPGMAAEPWREPLTGMEFVAIPKGCFQMGLPADAFEEDSSDLHRRARLEMPQHEACVDAFWMGRYEVREAEWETVMGKRPKAGAADLPAAGVTWDEAAEFARRLSEQSGDKAHFRLPTEAEWEYACRAGAQAVTHVPTWDELNDKAWYSSPYKAYSSTRLPGIQPVGGKKANAFGLHDMLGNVWEWTQDAYLPDAYAHHALYNPVIERAAEQRVIRGGGQRTDRHMTRCEARAWMSGQEVFDTVGVRLVRDR